MTCDAKVRYVIHYRNVEPDGKKSRWYEAGYVPPIEDLDLARSIAKKEAGKRYMSGIVTESRLVKQIVIETLMEEFR